MNKVYPKPDVEISVISRIKQLGQDALIYGLGGAASHGVAFLLVPIYTRIFTPVEYGALEMQLVINAFLDVLLMMGMIPALTFYFFEKKKEGLEAQAQLVTAILQWYLIWGASIIIPAILLSPIWNKFFFNDQLTSSFFAVAFISVLFIQTTNLISQVFRLTYRPWHFLTISLGSAWISAAIGLILVVWLKSGILGYFVGLGVGGAAGVFLGLINIHEYIRWNQWHWDAWPELLKFGLPLVPASLMTYFLTASDRWFINYYLSPYELGLYALGAKFALVIAFLIQSFGRAFMPFSMDLINNNDKAEADKSLALIFRYFSGLGYALIILLTGVAPFMVRLLAPAEYAQAYPIIGILSLSGLFFGYTYFSSLGCWKAEKTYLYSVSVLMATMMSLLLNVMLIPAYGIIGAAVATSIGMLVLALMSFGLSQWVWKIEFDFLTTWLQMFICLAAMGVIIYLQSKIVSSQVGIGVTTIVSLGLLVAVTIRKSELIRLWPMLKQKHAHL